jgi:hypothetical protein
LTLELVKRELEISKLQVIDNFDLVDIEIIFVPSLFLMMLLLMLPQESIAKTIEEKVTGEQRRYLLNELLKAIKKVVQPFFRSVCLYIFDQEFMMMNYICPFAFSYGTLVQEYIIVC